MKYWNYENYDGSLEDAITQIVNKGKTITCVTILNYAKRVSAAKQDILFPTKALIIYN